MGYRDVKTVDDVSRHTTPNAIRDAENDGLDHVYNVACGHLGVTKDGDLERTKASIRAILDEVSRRRERKAWVLSLVATVLTAVSAVSALTAQLRIQKLQETVRSHEQRILSLESPTPPQPSAPQTPLPPTTPDAPDATRPQKEDTQ